MADNMTILVGTSGQGVLRSADGGDTWRRIAIDQGLHSDAVVRCLAVHPNKPNLIYAGSDKGIYTSTDAGENWALLDNPLNNYTVWALVIDDEDPNLIYAGTGTPTPTVFFRSQDGGSSWQKTSMEAAAECPAVGTPRVVSGREALRDARCRPIGQRPRSGSPAAGHVPDPPRVPGFSLVVQRTRHAPPPPGRLRRPC